jgi:hypothetical protein
MEMPMYTEYVLRIARIASDVANYCDHVEHNETADPGTVSDAGRALRELASQIASQECIDLKAAYANRLRMIESANVLVGELSYDGGADADSARTWRDLQLVQARHDRAFHPDVLGMPKAEQLRHYALHLAKIAGALARRVESETVSVEILDRRLPDLLLFGIKLSTVTGDRLPDDRLTATTQHGPEFTSHVPAFA